METRTITEVKLYKLILNPMTDNTESGHIVAVSYDREKLIDWYQSMIASESYVEEGRPTFEEHGSSHNWRKSFQKGSPLEWFNPVDNPDFEPGLFGHGIQWEWVNEEEIDNIASHFQMLW